MVDLFEWVDVDVKTWGNKVKCAFFVSWKEMLCDNSVVDGEVNPGSPVVLVILASAIRVFKLLRGFKSFTRECRVAKLFSWYIKVEEQVTLLKNRVNIAGGTPSRIKKLIDMEAVGLSCMSLVLLDMRPDVNN